MLREMLQLTSVDEQNFDTKIGISNTHEENLIGVTELEVVVPKIADKGLDLFLQSSFLKSGDECLHILEILVSTLHMQKNLLTASCDT